MRGLLFSELARPRSRTACESNRLTCFDWQPNERAMKLAAIDIGIIHIPGENRPGNRYFYGEERFNHPESHLLPIYSL